MITLRAATSSDRAQLFSVIASIDNFNVQEKELAREVIRDGLASKANGYHILVAVADQDGLAGFICYGPIPITVKRWDVYWIAVMPQQGRQGIGTLLLEAMEERLGSGVRVYVDTSATSAYSKARSFYERQGYDVACLFPDFYGEGDDKIVYSKDL